MKHVKRNLPKGKGCTEGYVGGTLLLYREMYGEMCRNVGKASQGEKQEAGNVQEGVKGAYSSASSFCLCWVEGFSKRHNLVH